MDRKEIAIAVCDYALKNNDADTFVRSFAEYAKECLKDKDNKSKEENKTDTKQEDNDSKLVPFYVHTEIEGSGYLSQELINRKVKVFAKELVDGGFTGSIKIEVTKHD